MRNFPLSRRALLSAAPAAAAAQRVSPSPVEAAAVRRNDETVERLLQLQQTSPESRWRGAYPDEFGLHHGGSAGGILISCMAAFLHSGSRFHRDNLLVERMRLAAGYLERAQSPDGNVDLLTTNFNSPPDTAFVANNVASAAWLAAKRGAPELSSMLAPFLRRAGGAMAVGGVHTPNHRWVVCSALAQVHELFPNPAYTRRIDQWLAEGIDIDADGQYDERSTLVYNPITDRALIVVAHKLGRPDLLEPVRRNLDSMLYLIHPGGEVVTEISRRQDLNQRGDMGRYWFPMAYMAVRDGHRRYASIARSFEPQSAALAALMEYPELSRPGPEPADPPDNYEKQYPAVGIARIRRGLTSATLILGGSSRFFTLRRGDAVIQAVRFASAFFGKAQFVPSQAEKRADGYYFEQSLEAPYYQPFDPPRRVEASAWNQTRPSRRRSEVCRLRQSALVTETRAGFRLRIQAAGTKDVPVAVEINLRESGRLEGCEPAPKVEDGWILSAGHATYRAGAHGIRFGPGARAHAYTQVRGAEPKMPGRSVYLTGYTPFDHTLEFEWV